MVKMGRIHMRPFQWYLQVHWKYPLPLNSAIFWTQMKQHRKWWLYPQNVLFIYWGFTLLSTLYCIMTGSWKGRRNQYIQFVRVLYSKLPTNGKQLPTFPLEAVQGIEPWPQRWEARVLPLCHRGPPPPKCLTIRIPMSEGAQRFNLTDTSNKG